MTNHEITTDPTTYDNPIRVNDWTELVNQDHLSVERIGMTEGGETLLSVINLTDHTRTIRVIKES